MFIGDLVFSLVLAQVFLWETSDDGSASSEDHNGVFELSDVFAFLFSKNWISVEQFVLDTLVDGQFCGLRE